MVTPYRNVSSGPKDAFNFYQSQLRIRVECCFGMLVHRWAILRKPLPVGLTISKSTALVFCLCKLHNFCIDRQDSEVLPSTAQDTANVATHGGIPLEGETNRPSQLLDDGELVHEATRTMLQQRRRAATSSGEELPHEKLLHIVQEQNLQRPCPRGDSSSGRTN